MNKVTFILFLPLLLWVKKEMDELLHLIAEDLNGTAFINNTY